MKSTVIKPKIINSKIKYGYLSGTVKDSNGSPSIRKIIAYKNDKYSEVVGEAVSNSDGSFLIKVIGNVNDDFRIICLGDKSNNENSLLYDHVDASFTAISDFIPSKVYSSKSVIIDIKNNYGNSNYIGIRSINFYNAGSIVNTTYSHYATSYYNANYTSDNIFSTTLPIIGTSYNNEWCSGINLPINQRLICVFNGTTNFDQIVVVNSHASGSNTAMGAKDIKIYTSTDSITNTTYNAEISNSELIFEGYLNEHVSLNIADYQNIRLIQ
jgi:hypothetical protein